MDRDTPDGASKWTETKAPGIGGLHGKKSGRPSSRVPVNRLQIGLIPRSGRLLPTRTTIVAFRPLAETRQKGTSHIVNWFMKRPDQLDVEIGRFIPTKRHIFILIYVKIEDKRSPFNEDHLYLLFNDLMTLMTVSIKNNQFIFQKLLYFKR